MTYLNHYKPSQNTRAEQAMLDAYKKEMGDKDFNDALKDMVFFDVDAHLDYVVNEAFSNKTYAYSFSTDLTALFLEETLPANKGTDELSSQTYYGLTNSQKDTDKEYTFGTNGTYIFGEGSTR